jgi:hypothetical protein
MMMTWGASEEPYVCSFINLLSPPCLHWQVLGSLQPDTLMDYLQNSQLKIQAHDCGYLAGPSQVPVKVGMLSERALSMSYVIHTYQRCSGYRLTRRASSPIPVTHSLGSKPPDTPLLESPPVSFYSVRILLAKPSVDLTRPCSLDWVRRFHLEPADYLTCFSHLDPGACRSDAFLFLLTQSLAVELAAVDPRLPY